MKHIKRIFLQICKFIICVVDDNIGLYAAQASFFIIISLIPFIMLLLALLKFFIPINEIDIINTVQSYVPSQISQWVYTITDEIFTKSSDISIISVTAITTLWLASRGFMALYSGLNNVSGIKDMPNYFYCRFVSLVYTLCFLLALFLSIILFGFGNNIQKFLNGRFTALYNISSLIINLRILIFMTLVSLCFAAFYTILPNKKIKFKKQLPGAVMASVGWMAFSYAYSIYIEYFSNYSYVYGSLAAIVFLMLWLYFCMNIFLYGAEFNKILESGAFK